jgi:hypothetical protein
MSLTLGVHTFVYVLSLQVMGETGTLAWKREIHF